MSGKKVKFHALERVDKIDIEALQDLSHKDIDDQIGNICGDVEGLLTPLSYTVDNTTELIGWNDFVFLGKYAESDDNTSSRPGYVGKYESTNNANNVNASFDLYKIHVQNQYTANTALPAAIGAAGWNLGFYPFVWARVVEYDGAQSTRRFWSVANADEISTAVDTRIETSVEIKIDHIKPSDTSPYKWAKIGQLRVWEVTGGVVNLKDDGVYAWTLSDDLLNFADAPEKLVGDLQFDTFNRGLRSTFRTLLGLMNQMLDNGTQDPSSTVNRKDWEQPYLSLQGLYHRRTLRSSATFWRALDHNFTEHIKRSTTDDGDFQIYMQQDHTLPLHLHLTEAAGNTNATYNMNWSSSYLAFPSSYLYSMFIRFPAALAGRRFSVALTPVYRQNFIEFKNSGSENVTDLHGQTWYIVDEGLSDPPNVTNAEVDALNIVQKRPYWPTLADVNASTQETDHYGFRIACDRAIGRPFADTLTAGQYMEVGLKVDIIVYPNEAGSEAIL